MRVVVTLVLAAALLGIGDAGPLETDVTVEPLEEAEDDLDKTSYNSDNTDAPIRIISLGDESGEFTIREEGEADDRRNSSGKLPVVWDGWMYGGLAEGMLGFGLESEDPRCARDGRLYRQHLDNLTLWAVRMFDSSALTPNGLLAADSFQFGHFDECVAIETDGELAITGKYCLATVKLGPDPRQRPRWYDPPQKLYVPLPATAHAWDRMKMTDDPRQLRRDVLRWAVCVPSSCSARDVGLSLSRSLAPPLARRGVRSEVTVTTDDCYSVWEAPPFSTGYYIIVGLMYFMFFFNFICTLIDYSIPEDAKMPLSLDKVVRVFSTYTNIRKLFKSKRKAEFKLLHCLKFLSMLAIILGHKEMYSFAKPIQNTEFVESFYSHWSSALFLNGGNYVVDVFFMLSGFLTCHFLVKELERRNSINIPLAIIGHILKLLPVYAFALAFHAVVLPYIGSGPMWNELVWREALRCQKNWWTNMLFINNYVNADNMCMIQSWYLACDLHFFVVGVILISIRHKHRTLGNALMAIALVLSIVSPAYVTYVNHYWGSVRLHHGLQIDPVAKEHFRDMYIPSHTRFIPYIVGLIMSYINQHLLKTGFKYSLTYILIAIPVGTVVNLSTTLIGYVFYVEERPYSLWENVIYAGICRVLWAVTLVHLIMIDSTTGLGKFGAILRHRAWAPLGRLAYCAFLVHTVPLLYFSGTLRSAQYHTKTMVALTFLGEVAISFFLALYINLMIESPWQRILKMVLNRALGGPPKTGPANKNTQQVGESQMTFDLDGSADKLPSCETPAEPNGNRVTIRYRDENGVFKS